MSSCNRFGNQNPIYGDSNLVRDDPVIVEIAKSESTCAYSKQMKRDRADYNCH